MKKQLQSFFNGNGKIIAGRILRSLTNGITAGTLTGAGMGVASVAGAIGFGAIVPAAIIVSVGVTGASTYNQSKKSRMSARAA